MFRFSGGSTSNFIIQLHFYDPRFLSPWNASHAVMLFMTGAVRIYCDRIWVN